MSLYVFLFVVVSCLYLLFSLCFAFSPLPNIPFICFPSLFLVSLLHVISFLFVQDYESKLQALQKQVETRSLAAETTEEEEEEEEGET